MLLPNAGIAPKMVVCVAVLTDVDPDRGRIPNFARSLFIYTPGVVKYTGKPMPLRVNRGSAGSKSRTCSTPGFRTVAC